MNEGVIVYYRHINKIKIIWHLETKNWLTKGL